MNIQNELNNVISQYHNLQNTAASKSNAKAFMEIGAQFANKSDKSLNDHEGFKKACQDAVKAWKGKESTKTTPAVFTQLKSDIAASLKLGLNPADYKSAFDMKQAKVAANKAAKAEASESGEGESKASLDYKTQAMSAVAGLMAEHNGNARQVMDMLEAMVRLEQTRLNDAAMAAEAQATHGTQKGFDKLTEKAA